TWYMFGDSTNPIDNRQGNFGLVTTFTNLRIQVQKSTAAVPAPTDPKQNIVEAISTSSTGASNTMLVSTNGGSTWAAFSPAPPSTNYQGLAGAYASSFVGAATSAGPFFIGGSDSSAGGGYVFMDNGGAWTNITTDAAGNGPHTAILTMYLDVANNL